MEITAVITKTIIESPHFPSATLSPRMVEVITEGIRAKVAIRRYFIGLIGARGAMLCNENGAKVYPTIKVTPVDTTAAGDTFNAGFVVACLYGLDKFLALYVADVVETIESYLWPVINILLFHVN